MVAIILLILLHIGHRLVAFTDIRDAYNTNPCVLQYAQLLWYLSGLFLSTGEQQISYQQLLEALSSDRDGPSFAMGRM